MSKNIYDNSNLAESYSGITTPLTFSFARYVYQEVYKSFCQMMGVSQGTIKANDDMFRQMVVFIGHRMYYDLINWYRLISFLPGYKFNRRFLEKMLGVQKEHDHDNGQRYGFWQRYFIDLSVMIWQFVKMIFTFIFMGVLVNNFNKKFDQIFEQSDKLDLKSFDLKRLRRIYLSLVKDLTTRWKVPIANDLAVMISTGIADKLFKKWLQEDNVYNHLRMQSHSSLISLDPGLEVIKISQKIKADSDLRELFKNSDENFVWDKLNSQFQDNKVSQIIFQYLKKFGSRSPNELKLEAITLQESPQVFVSFLQKIVVSDRNNSNHVGSAGNIQTLDYKNCSVFKKALLKFIVKWSVNSIRRREETRFKRTLIFGFARRVFLEMGDRLSQQNLLKSQRDIFYLKIGEIFSLIDKKMNREQVEKLINQRQIAGDAWREIDLPRRIETRKAICEKEKEFLHKISHSVDKTSLSGSVASRIDQDIVSGTALVLTDFDPKADYVNKILVTRQTDPGWSIVFPLVKGIVVERGGMLSHAAIVARELQIPCLVGVDKATKMIKNDTNISLNFSNGEIIYGQ